MDSGDHAALTAGNVSPEMAKKSGVSIYMYT